MRAPDPQVYVAEPGYMLSRAGLPKHAIITAVDGQPTKTLEDFAGALQAIPHGTRVPVEYYVFAERVGRGGGGLHPLTSAPAAAPAEERPSADGPALVREAPVLGEEG